MTTSGPAWSMATGAASELKTVMFGFTVATPLLTVTGLVVVARARFSVIFGLETIGNVVCVTFVDLLVILTGALVDSLVNDRVESLEVVHVLAGVLGAEVCFVD